ncbi:MAG: hypothetical protein GHCLOJNM_04327 [bacterium]|nr:hypothetical protein [bacterium]
MYYSTAKMEMCPTEQDGFLWFRTGGPGRGEFLLG